MPNTLNNPWKRIDILQVLNDLPVGILITNMQGEIIFWNEAMERLTGYRKEDALGQSCTIIACTGKDAESFAKRCPIARGETEKISGMECRIKNVRKESIPVVIYAQLLKDSLGEKIGVLQTFTDLTPIQKLEYSLLELRHQQRERVSTEITGRLIGESPKMKEVYNKIRLAANSDANILILGETGTGKERVVEEIHRLSRRANGPLIKVNCSALPETLMESELFGHVKGAFTGAIRDHIGRFELANHGTLFLDEVGDLSPFIQLKLLRVIQEKTFERIGDSTPIHVDVRIIAATHKDLKRLIQEGLFRQDLYYRLCVYPIYIPPLRERREDIPLLIDYFIQQFNQITGKKIRGVTPGALQLLMNAPYPGNVRELENAIEHAFVACENDLIAPEHLPIDIRIPSFPHNSEKNEPDLSPSLIAESIPGVKKGLPSTQEELLALLKRYHGNRSLVAQHCGVSRITLWRKMKQWGLLSNPHSR